MNDTKTVILNEALSLFAAEGYKAVTVEQIAAAVGIKAPSLYKHFPGKRAIFTAILQRMEQADAELAADASMPDAGYASVPSLDDILSFTKAMFRHWTEDSFGCCFRRLLTVEQYHDPDMALLYRQYLSTGPMEYMEEVFTSMGLPKETALAFYAPMFYLYSAYDSAVDKSEVFRALDAHLEQFQKSISKTEETK